MKKMAENKEAIASEKAIALEKDKSYIKFSKEINPDIKSKYKVEFKSLNGRLHTRWLNINDLKQINANICELLLDIVNPNEFVLIDVGLKPQTKGVD